MRPENEVKYWKAITKDLAAEIKHLKEQLRKAYEQVPCPFCNGTGGTQCGSKCVYYGSRNCVELGRHDGCPKCVSCAGTGKKYAIKLASDEEDLVMGMTTEDVLRMAKYAEKKLKLWEEEYYTENT